MKYKVAELDGALLDAAVARAIGTGFLFMEGRPYVDDTVGVPFKPSVQWSHGGPIIERERVSVYCCQREWIAALCVYGQDDEFIPTVKTLERGPTPLIATMRAYVASKFGDEVDL